MPLGPCALQSTSLGHLSFHPSYKWGLCTRFRKQKYAQWKAPGCSGRLRLQWGPQRQAHPRLAGHRD